MGDWKLYFTLYLIYLQTTLFSFNTSIYFHIFTLNDFYIFSVGIFFWSLWCLKGVWSSYVYIRTHIRMAWKINDVFKIALYILAIYKNHPPLDFYVQFINYKFCWIIVNKMELILDKFQNPYLTHNGEFKSMILLLQYIANSDILLVFLFGLWMLHIATNDSSEFHS